LRSLNAAFPCWSCLSFFTLQCMYCGIHVYYTHFASTHTLVSHCLHINFATFAGTF
jgi:hypothetical protein